MRTGPAIGLAVVALVLIGGVFYLERGGSWMPSPIATTTMPVATTTLDYYHDTSSWQAYRADAAGFSISYPIDFETNQLPSPAPSTDWRLGADGSSGTLSFTLTIPGAFEPQTNFSDAKLTVGESGDDAAVADCLTPDQSGGPAVAPTTMTINGINFTVFTSSDAGAGNIYQTKSYRAMHAGKCYAVEYTIHSTQIANYPASYNLQPFDEAKLTDVLGRIVGTVTFL